MKMVPAEVRTSAKKRGREMTSKPSCSTETLPKKRCIPQINDTLASTNDLSLDLEGFEPTFALSPGAAQEVANEFEYMAEFGFDDFDAIVQSNVATDELNTSEVGKETPNDEPVCDANDVLVDNTEQTTNNQ